MDGQARDSSCRGCGIRRPCLLRAFARAGHGVAPVPVVLEEQFQRQYDLRRVGLANTVQSEFYAISVERKVKHPAVAAIVEQARQLFAG
jgi:LysR family transcriptional regulator, transcriptional activator of nhaA